MEVQCLMIQSRCGCLLCGYNWIEYTHTWACWWKSKDCFEGYPLSSFLCVWAAWNVLYLKKGRSVKSLDEPGVRAHGQWHWPPAVCCMRRTHSRRTADWSPCRWSSPSSPSLRFQSLGWRSYLKWEWIVHELYVFIMIILNFLWMSTRSTSQLPLTLTLHIFESNADYESKQDCDIILPSLEME